MIPFLLAAATASAPALPLDVAIATAQAHQPQLAEARSQLDAARARADEATAPMLPQVSGQASYQRSGNGTRTGAGGVVVAPGASSYWNAGVNASQLIVDFGSAPSRRDAALHLVDAASASVRTTLVAVDENVRTAYFDAQAAKAQARVAEETLANQRRHLDQIQAFVGVGTRPPIDLAQARTDVANAEVQRITAANAYATAKAQLAQAMGLEAAGPFEVSDAPFPAVAGEDASADALFARALRDRPELATLAAQDLAQGATVRAAANSDKPSLSASAGGNDSGADVSALGLGWQAGLTLNWPIFSGGLQPAQAREARATEANLQAQIAAERQQVRFDVDQAVLAVRAGKAAASAARVALANARTRLQLAEGRYGAGVGNVIELGDAQVAAAQAAFQVVQADDQLAKARAQLLRAVGSP